MSGSTNASSLFMFWVNSRRLLWRHQRGTLSCSCQQFVSIWFSPPYPLSVPFILAPLFSFSFWWCFSVEWLFKNRRVQIYSRRSCSLWYPLEYNVEQQQPTTQWKTTIKVVLSFFFVNLVYLRWQKIHVAIIYWFELVERTNNHWQSR